MRKIIPILCILLPLTTIGQIADTIRSKKMTIGLTFSPDYCYRTLKPDNSSESIAELRDSYEIPKIGYTSGISLVYRLNRKVNIETGIQFSDKGEQTNQLELIYYQPEPNAPEKVKYTYSYYYIDIPLKANFLLIDKRLQLFLSGGISSNIFIDQKTTSFFTYANGSTDKNSKTSNSGFIITNLAILGGLGIDYNIAERIRIRLEPIYRRSITTIVNSQIRRYLYSYGINIGASYKI